MKALRISAYEDSVPLTKLFEWARLDRIQKDQLMDTPEVADLIAFVKAPHYVDDPGFKAVRNHLWTEQLPEQVFMPRFSICAFLTILPMLGGIYIYAGLDTVRTTLTC